MSKALCEHFGQSRAELFEIVAATGIRTFSGLIAKLRHRHRVRHLQADGRVDPGVDASIRRAHPGRRAGVAAGHQRPLPCQHAAQRHLLGGAADAGRRVHAGAADRDRRGRPRLRAVHQGHRRPADRPVRRPRRAAAGDLAAPRRRRHGVRARLRQVAAHREVLRRARPGAATACRTPSGMAVDCWRTATAGCARRTSSSSASRAAPASAPRRGARTSASSRPSTAGTSTSAATADSRPSTRCCWRRASTTRR